MPTFNIFVTAPSARQAVIEFVEELIDRNPLACERIYSYMAQEYLPDHPNSTLHIIAKRETAWAAAGDHQRKALHRLKNGWYLYTTYSPRGYTSQLLQRIEEAFSYPNFIVKIYAYLDAGDRGPGIRYYTKEDIERFIDSVDLSTPTQGPKIPSSREATLTNFWAGFIDKAAEQQINITATPSGTRHWLAMPSIVGASQKYNTFVSKVMKRNVIVCGIWIGKNNKLFDGLLLSKEQIEAITGPLEWKHHKMAMSISASTQYVDDGRAYDWLIAMYRKFAEAFTNK